MTRIPTPGGSPSDIPSFGMAPGPAGKGAQGRASRIVGATPATVPGDATGGPARGQSGDRDYASGATTGMAPQPQPDATAIGAPPAIPAQLPHVADALRPDGLGSGTELALDMAVGSPVAGDAAGRFASGHAGDGDHVGGVVGGAMPLRQPDAIAYVDGFGVLPASQPQLPHVAGALRPDGLGGGTAPAVDIAADVPVPVDAPGGFAGDRDYASGVPSDVVTGDLGPLPGFGGADESAGDFAFGFGVPGPRPEAVRPAVGVAPFDPLRVTGVLSPAAFGGHPGYPTSSEPVFAGAGAPSALDAPAEPGGPGGPVVSYTLRVNGAMHVVDGAWIGESLLAVLRERLGLPGAKDGCGQGVCGTCTVLVDGAPSAACMVPAATVGDRAVTTVEGLTDQGACGAIQRALIAHGAVQCGFCVPGVVVSAHALLARIPKPDEATVRRALAGHPCRCVGPNRMVAAVCAVAAGEQDESSASVFEPAQTNEPGASGARA